MRSSSASISSRPTTAPRELTCSTRAWAPSVVGRGRWRRRWRRSTIGSNRPLTCSTSTGARGCRSPLVSPSACAPAPPRRQQARPAAALSRPIASLRKGASGVRRSCAACCPPSRVTIVAGKGGVGKTTVTAVLARCGRRRRTRACSSSSSTASRCSASSSASVRARRSRRRRRSRSTCASTGSAASPSASSTSGVIDVVATAAPGIDDIVVLGKIKQLERSGDWDVIVVDGPAAGHAVTFLTSAAGLRDAVRGGPVRDAGRRRPRAARRPDPLPGGARHAARDDARSTRCVETAYALEDRVGVRLGPVVVNDVDGLGGEPLVPDPSRRRARRRTRGGACCAGGARSAARAARCRTRRSSASGRARRSSSGTCRCCPWPGSVRRRRRPRRVDPRRDGAVRAWRANHARPRSTPVARGRRGDRVLRVGRRRQDDDGRRHRPRGGARRAPAPWSCTIDPARRLADALGLADGLAAEPQRIGSTTRRRRSRRAVGDDARHGGGVRRARAAQRRRATSRPSGSSTNPFYRNISGALSGTQEYMAAETLHQLHGDERFDVVVVDTPPSRNALDFLEAPGVLARFLDHRAVPAADAAGAARHAASSSAATQPLLRAIGRVVGSDVLADAVAFFQAFAGMESGFRQRAEDVIAPAAIGRHPLRRRRLAAPRHGDRGRLVRRAARRAGHRPRRRRGQPGPPAVRRQGPRPRPQAHARRAPLAARRRRAVAQRRRPAGAGRGRRATSWRRSPRCSVTRRWSRCRCCPATSTTSTALERDPPPPVRRPGDAVDGAYDAGT